MLRIAETTPEPGIVVLALEGSVVGPWVAELRRLCDCALTTGARLTLDVARVEFVDRAGIELLRHLESRRVALRNGSAFVTAQLRG